MRLKFEKVNATALVKEMAAKLETVLSSKMKALNVRYRENPSVLLFKII